MNKILSFPILWYLEDNKRLFDRVTSTTLLAGIAYVSRDKYKKFLEDYSTKNRKVKFGYLFVNDLIMFYL